jgi:hypothetical protein
MSQVWLSFSLLVHPFLEANGLRFSVLGTLKHAQIAAVEWNRKAIAQIKAGMGMSGTFRFLKNISLVLTPFSGLA